MKNELPCRKSPCTKCPFKKDTLKEWLGKDRMTEIINQDSFVCHKNIKKQCAGHMILNREKNIFFRLATAIYKDFKLLGKEKIFSSKEDCIKHHT